MKISIANTAGFCMGVKRAVDTAFEHVRKARGPVYTFGPLIHNPQVLELLAARGVNMLEEIPEQGTGSVIIRAHGIPPQQREALQKAGFEIIDATCPKVIKVQKIIEKYHRDGYTVIILGEKDHPEIIGLNGYAENQAIIVADLDELKALPIFEKAAVVAQTTLNLGLFDAARDWVKNERPQYKIINTICNSTELRQKELRVMRDNVEGFIIVGGFDSGNTRRLAEVARETGLPALHVESAKDLSPQNCAPFNGMQHIGLTAGASAPNWTIQAVNHALGNMALKRYSIRWFWTKITPLLFLAHTPLALAFLAYICQHFYGKGLNLTFPILAFCYGWSMHVTSKISGTKAAGFYTPLLAVIYENHKALLTATCIVAGGIALLLGFYISRTAGIVIGTLYILRCLYDFWPMARRFPGQYNYFIDMPYTKALCVFVAWGVVAGTLPGWGLPTPLVASVSLWAALIAFTRVMCQDLFGMQTDRICGQTTIMLLLGIKKGLLLITVLLLALTLYPPVLYYTGIHRAAILPIMLCPGLMLAVVAFFACNRYKILMPFEMEILVSLAFSVTGLILLLSDIFALV